MLIVTSWLRAQAKAEEKGCKIFSEVRKNKPPCKKFVFGGPPNPTGEPPVLLGILTRSL
jgi:hypothetical protein